MARKGSDDRSDSGTGEQLLLPIETGPAEPPTRESGTKSAPAQTSAMKNGNQTGRVRPAVDPSAEGRPKYDDKQTWNRLYHEFKAGAEVDFIGFAEKALAEYPTDPEVLLQASLVFVFKDRPDRALTLLKRITKRYTATLPDHMVTILALLHKKRLPQASKLWKKHFRDIGLSNWYITFLPAGYGVLDRWLAQQLKPLTSPAGRPSKKPGRKTGKPAVTSPPVRPEPVKKDSDAGPAGEPPTPLPVFDAHIPITVAFPPGQQFLTVPADMDQAGAETWFSLRESLSHLSLAQGFDELLCLPYLRRVETYWYQMEAVRKVLKQFRGRVLLADEVGLGKTIEAGLVMKEYMLRGMVGRVLILTPASLVGQWSEEMESKFDISFTTTYDPLLRRDPGRFWEQDRIIASIATARRRDHASILANLPFDLVIVDEAHHLRNRSSQNWKLVDSLKKRFLLLLSATPVQNSLVELYNLLTLLKPGIFKTQKEFRRTYMTPGKPRLPANRGRMRDLMRDVMIRNIRSLVDVHLPPRTATTLRLDPTPEETACYDELNRLIQAEMTQGPAGRRLALHQLLVAAGSSPAAAAVGVRCFTPHSNVSAWSGLGRRYRKIESGAKDRSLLELLRLNPEEKKLIFVNRRQTLDHIEALLDSHGIPFARFDGSLSGPAKDKAIERFRTEVPVLLSSESGGEGRNLQFCNTMINYDLPWNPMVIEQRIGRIHRIGQHREVFIFNLTVKYTIEEKILQILDEKINMFELVVGEIDSILGEMDEKHGFADLAFAAWVQTAGQDRDDAFRHLEERLVQARKQYDSVKELDEYLFDDEFVTG